MFARRAVVLLLLGSLAPQGSAEDLTQFRDAPAPEGSVLRASNEEFRQAVNAVRNQAAAEAPYNAPTLQPGPPIAQGWNSPPASSPQSFSPYGNTPQPRFAGPVPAAPPGRPPVEQLLLQKAFELERVAHELEMHRMYEESKTVRQAAATLRDGARRSGPRPAEPPKSSSLPEQPATAQVVRKPVTETLPPGPVESVAPPRPRAVVPAVPPASPRRAAPSNSSGQRRATPNTPSTQRRAGSSDSQDREEERSLLGRRRWLRNPSSGGYDGRSGRN